MSPLKSILILAAAFLTVFLEVAFNGFRHWLGAQVDLLPCLMVYAALSSNLVTVALLGVMGGLCYDSMSANPLGVTILPLFLVGFVIYARRDLILKGQFFAQFMLGLGASAVVPLMVLLLLLSTRQKPLVGFGFAWQWLVMTLAGGLLTPVCCRIFDKLDHALVYQPAKESSFRPDREIRRGR